MELWQILTIIFGLLAAFFGVYWGKAKQVISELKILFGLISDAIEDDQITRDELKVIAEEIKKILNIFKLSSVKEAIQNIKTNITSIKLKKGK